MSCSKNRNNAECARHDINDTFAQIIQGTDNTNSHHNNNTRNNHVGAIFPPPPPPYVFVNMSANNNDTNSHGSITKIPDNPEPNMQAVVQDHTPTVLEMNTNSTDVRNIHRNNTWDDLLQVPIASLQNTQT